MTQTQLISTQACRLHLPAEAVPLVLDSPHSGAEYPEDFDHAVDMQALRDAEDTHVEELFGDAPAHGASLLAARFPRSYIDCNRSEDDIDMSLLDAPWRGLVNESPKTRLGKGLVWRLLDDGSAIYRRKLSPLEVRARIERCYRPYHASLAALVSAMESDFACVWHVNCHSMPSVAGLCATDKPGMRHPDFVVGDRDGTTASADFRMVVVDFLRQRGFSVGVNDPYRGVEIVRRYGRPERNRHSLQLEINRALYMNERTRERTAGYSQLRRLVNQLVETLAEFAKAGAEQARGRRRAHHVGRPVL